VPNVLPTNLLLPERVKPPHFVAKSKGSIDRGGGGDKRRIGGGIHEWGEGRGEAGRKKLVKTMMKGNSKLGPYSNLCQSGGMYSSSTLPIIQHPN
jgi:hypothetical protein